MMINTLYNKLALSMFVLLLCIGFMFIVLVRNTSIAYEQEVTQRLNAKLAQHVIDHEPLIADQKVNEEALEKLFHWLMFVNPNLEVYLLDSSGEILAYSAPKGKIKRKQVALQVVQRFIEGEVVFPLLGDDPRNEQRKKIFSVAPIVSDSQQVQGYLYIILASEQYDNITNSIRENVSLRTSFWWLLVSLLGGLCIGSVMFYFLTARLRRLSQTMNRYSVDANDQVTFPCKVQGGDEIDSLGRTFNQMSQRMQQQVCEIRNNDLQRRDLITNISHDLRTPLTTLHGYLETMLIKSDSLSEPEKEQYLQAAIKQSSRIQELITGLFELSRLESCEQPANCEVFCAAELLQDVAQKYELVATQRNISLRHDFGGGSALVYGDIGLIQRVFENLIDNALKHTPSAGSVQLRVSTTEQEVVIAVTNTGPGIPQDELEKVFQRFYRSSSNPRDSTGTGLGLSIVQRIVALHQGVIKVTSTQDEATTFTVTLAQSTS